MIADNPNYNQRIEQGKRIESKIIFALRAMGFHIDDATAHQDMHDKVDGFWIDKKGTRYPFQIKWRQSGDDIIFELIQNMVTGNEGRDYKSSAQLYIVADTHGKTRMFLAKPIKEKAKSVLASVQSDLKKNPQQFNFQGYGWEVKIQFDRADGHKKMVAYFSPELFEPLAVWRLNLYEE